MEFKRSTHYGIRRKRIEETVLALLTTFSFDNGNSWKGHDFQIMNRLHEQGFISNPVNKNKSIWLTQEGLERAGKSPIGYLPHP